MKTILDRTTRDELVDRINRVNENCTANWGQMNVYQMLIHCIRWEQMALGKKKYRQTLLGRLFGKMALKGMIKDEAPLKRNVPTFPDLRVTQKEGDVEPLKMEWITLIREYADYPDFILVHPFFGKMDKEQVGLLAYKHSDHHLRQFGC